MSDEPRELDSKEGDEFHDVVMTVNQVLPGSVVHDGPQVITARMVTKLDNAGVDALMDILREYKKDYQEGAGPLLFTLVGKFSR